MQCSKCHVQLPPQAQFCGSCGTSTAANGSRMYESYLPANAMRSETQAVKVGLSETIGATLLHLVLCVGAAWRVPNLLSPDMDRAIGKSYRWMLFQAIFFLHHTSVSWQAVCFSGGKRSCPHFFHLRCISQVSTSRCSISPWPATPHPQSSATLALLRAVVSLPVQRSGHGFARP